MFPWVNIACVFVSVWAALSPRFREEGNNQKNWSVFKWNMLAAKVNAALIIIGYLVGPIEL